MLFMGFGLRISGCGLRLYLKEHLYGNAEWADLVRALEVVSGQSLRTWADMWIKHRGTSQAVETWWKVDGGWQLVEEQEL